MRGCPDRTARALVIGAMNVSFGPKTDRTATLPDPGLKRPRKRCKLSAWIRPGRGKERAQNAIQAVVFRWVSVFPR